LLKGFKNDFTYFDEVFTKAFISDLLVEIKVWTEWFCNF